VVSLALSHRAPYLPSSSALVLNLRKRGHQPGGRQPLTPRAALGAGCQVEAQEQRGADSNIARGSAGRYAQATRGPASKGYKDSLAPHTPRRLGGAGRVRRRVLDSDMVGSRHGQSDANAVRYRTDDPRQHAASWRASCAPSAARVAVTSTCVLTGRNSHRARA
jgi:hypothetical protein